MAKTSKKTNAHMVKLNDKNEERSNIAMEHHAKDSVAELYRMYLDRDWAQIKKEGTK